MHSEPPIILLLEDSLEVGMLIEHTIAMTMPECRFLWARTIEEAYMRLCGLQIAVFLLDVELPDGNGLDFLMEAALLQPEARAIVMSGNRLPDLPKRAAALGALRFMEKPVPPDELRKALRAAVSCYQGTSLESAVAFHGRLRQLTPVDVLQLKSMSNAKTVVLFRSASESGRVYFENGEMIHAEAGSLVGMPALNRIIAYKGGDISEEPFKEVPRTLQGTWQMLLMNAAHALDEQLAGNPMPAEASCIRAGALSLATGAV